MSTDKSVHLWLLFVRTYAHFKNGGMAAGMAAFNALTVTDPVLAHKLRGTDFDPFHNDERINQFLTEVARQYADTTP